MYNHKWVDTTWLIPKTHGYHKIAALQAESAGTFILLGWSSWSHVQKMALDMFREPLAWYFVQLANIS